MKGQFFLLALFATATTLAVSSTSQEYVRELERPDGTIYRQPAARFRDPHQLEDKQEEIPQQDHYYYLGTQFLDQIRYDPQRDSSMDTLFVLMLNDEKINLKKKLESQPEPENLNWEAVEAEIEREFYYEGQDLGKRHMKKVKEEISQASKLSNIVQQARQQVTNFFKDSPAKYRRADVDDRMTRALVTELAGIAEEATIRKVMSQARYVTDLETSIRWYSFDDANYVHIACKWLNEKGGNGIKIPAYIARDLVMTAHYRARNSPHRYRELLSWRLKEAGRSELESKVREKAFFKRPRELNGRLHNLVHNFEEKRIGYKMTPPSLYGLVVRRYISLYRKKWF